MQVEQNDVRFELRKSRLHLVRVSDASNFVGRVGEKRLQKKDVARLVVNDQDAGGQSETALGEDTVSDNAARPR